MPDDANGSPDLELVATDALTEELTKRFDNSVFLGTKLMTDDETYVHRTFRTNNRFALLGLLEEFKVMLLRRIRKG